jgi:hypothetical protein
MVVGLTVLAQFPAHALERKAFGDIVVGAGGTDEGVSTVFGDILVEGRVIGDVETHFGDVRVNAPVEGRVKADFGDVYVNAPVQNDVEVGHGDAYLGEDAMVKDLILGNGDYFTKGNPRITGNVSAGMRPFPGRQMDEDRWGIAEFAGWFFGALVFVAVAVLAAVFAPRQISSSSRRMEESFGRSLLIGIASVPAAVVLSVVLAVSLIGIPLLLLAAPVYLAFVFFGALVAAFFLGRRLLISTGRYHAGNALAAAVGASVISAAYLIPFIGELVLYGLALTGAGGAIMALFYRLRPYHTS